MSRITSGHRASSRGLFLQGHPIEGLTTEEMHLVAGDFLADRRECLGVGEQKRRRVVLEDLLDLKVELRALGLVADGVRTSQLVREVLVAPARPVSSGSDGIAAPAQSQDLARVGIIPRT